MITWENYEEYMMMHADGELHPAEEQELIAFLNTHPELKSEMSLYESTRLSPDETHVYNDKNSLLKPAPVKHTLAFPQWQKYAIAAGIALLVSVSLFKYIEANKPGGQIAQVDTTKPVLPAARNNAPIQIAETPKKDSTDIAIVPLRSHKPMPVIHSEGHPEIVHNKQVARKAQEGVAVANNNTSIATHATQISALAVSGIAPLPCNNTAASLAVVAVPAFSLSAGEHTARRSFWENLPLDEDKKNEIKDVAMAITNAYNKINNQKQDPENNAINIDIKNRKLSISF